VLSGGGVGLGVCGTRTQSPGFSLPSHQPKQRKTTFAEGLGRYVLLEQMEATWSRSLQAVQQQSATRKRSSSSTDSTRRAAEHTHAPARTTQQLADRSGETFRILRYGDEFSKQLACCKYVRSPVKSRCRNLFRGRVPQFCPARYPTHCETCDALPAQDQSPGL